MEIGKLTIEDLSPKVPEKYRHLAPDRKHLRASFTISGVHASVPNAIRRVLVAELPIVGLNCQDQDIETNDPHIAQLHEIIIVRLQQIPIDQNTPLENIYNINVTNNTESPMKITMGMLTQIGGAKSKIPCEKLSELLTLAPGKYFKCKIHVDQSKTLGRAVAANVVSVVQDDSVLLNSFENKGVSSSVSDHRNWKISFVTNGTAPPVSIIRAICADLGTRLSRVSDSLHNDILYINDEYQFEIIDTSTIGDLIVRQIYETQSNISAIALNISEGRVIIRSKTDGDITEIISGAISQCEKIINRVDSHFK